MRLGKNLGARLLNAVPIHVRSTITFDGGSGSGGVGTVDVFTITGRVFIEKVTAYCTTTLTQGGGGATISFGGASDTDGFMDSEAVTDIDIGDWWGASLSLGGLFTMDVNHTVGAVTSQAWKVTDEDCILTIGTDTVATGVLVFDIWYEPITDDGALVAS